MVETRINFEDASVNCNCSKQHPLMEGVDALVYWCGDNLKEIVEGDYIDIREKGE